MSMGGLSGREGNINMEEMMQERGGNNKRHIIKLVNPIGPEKLRLQKWCKIHVPGLSHPGVGETIKN